MGDFLYLLFISCLYLRLILFCLLSRAVGKSRCFLSKPQYTTTTTSFNNNTTTRVTTNNKGCNKGYEFFVNKSRYFLFFYIFFSKFCSLIFKRVLNAAFFFDTLFMEVILFLFVSIRLFCKNKYKTLPSLIFL